MPVIAIETATMAGSIAVVNEKRVVSELTLNIKATHSERLMAAIDRLLDDTGLTLHDMRGIAVSIGPGSFTGLRIGLGTAKGLSFASGKPLIGVPTLDALALNIPFSRYTVCPILDARKGEVYTALYNSNGHDRPTADSVPAGSGSFSRTAPPMELTKITDDMALSPVALIETIKDKTVFLGDGVNTYRSLLKERLGDLYHEAPLPLQAPRASNVAMLALKRLEKGDFDDPFTLIPRYVRKSEAELRFKG